MAIAGEVQLTFEALAKLVTDRCASWRGRFRRGDRVAVVPRPCLRDLVSLYSLMEAGTPMLLLHPRQTTQQHRETIDRAGASWIVEGARLVPTGVHANEELPNETLAIIPTSGSSGTPKLVVLTRGSFAASARSSELNLGWRDDDRWLLCMPAAHVGGFSVVTRTLLARRTLVTAPESSMDQLVKTMCEHDVTLLSLVPTMLHRIVQGGIHAPPSLRAVLVGGAPVPSALLLRGRALGWPLLATYGLTEACSQVATATPGEDHDGVGVPLPGIEVRILDGEILLRGPSLFCCYVGGARREPREWFRTGDIGRIDESGRLHVLGRRSDMIVTGGENVSPAEVESVLMNCAGVESVCVFGVDDDEWGQVVAVAVVGSVEEKSLIDCRTQLAKHQWPRLWARVEGLAVNAMGKTDRRAVREAVAPRLLRL